MRIDSDVIENIIKKDDAQKVSLTEVEQDALRYTFESVVKGDDKTHYYVNLEAVSADALPAFLTQNEFMRRMKDMAAHQQQMSFYGQMPDQYTLSLNTSHPLISTLVKDITTATAEKANPIVEQLQKAQAEEQRLRDEQKDKKPADLTEDEKKAVDDVTKQVAQLKQQLKDVYAGYAAGDNRVGQIVDVALLAAGKLTGEALANFVIRTVKMM